MASFPTPWPTTATRCRPGWSRRACDGGGQPQQGPPHGASPPLAHPAPSSSRYYRYERTTDKLWASLLLPSAFSFGADILADYEYAEIGVTLENMHEGDYSFASCLFMLCVDTVLYTLLYLYLERVLPSRYGSREHPLFFLIPSWWLSDGSISTTRAALPRGAAFEPVDAAAAARPSIEVVGLTKAYGSGRMRKVAVDGLSLSFAEGQISCLLGHNGAGKTTLVRCLLGVIRYRGHALIGGIDVRRRGRHARIYRAGGMALQLPQARRDGRAASV